MNSSFVIQKNLKGIFYCSSHSTRIIEIENARFIKNDKISGSMETRKVEIQVVRVEIPLPKTSQVVVPTVAEQIDNLQE